MPIIDEILEKLENVCIGDEVAHIYSGTTSIAQVIYTDADMITVAFDLKEQSFDKKGNSIDGLKSVIRAKTNKEITTTKLSILFDEEWEILDENQLNNILSQLKTANKNNPSTKYVAREWLNC